MERFKNCTIKVDKEMVIRLVKYKYGSVKAYAKTNGISRVRFYNIVNNPHVSKDEKCLQILAFNLGTSIETILL